MSKYVFGGIYGPAKSGKTLAMIRSFPNGLFIAPRGALLCKGWLSREPKSVEAGGKVGLPEITKIIRQHAKDYPAIIVDDFSIILDWELAKCKKAVAGWGAFDNFNKRVYDFIEAARNADCHVFVTMHEQAPKEVGQDGQKRWVKGCPMVPGWQLPEKLPAMWDICARVVYDKKAKGWPHVLQTGPDSDYITGDRLAITPERFPMNLRDVLLSAGYDLPRPEELAYFEEHVAKLSLALAPALDGKPGAVKKVFVEHQKELMDATEGSPEFVRWIFMDALDRASLRKHSSNMLQNFIDSM
tara:strand:+ start:10111 stop:11007 length:897 start_codon:yes stop_codon:yes gene_type:complete